MVKLILLFLMLSISGLTLATENTNSINKKLNNIQNEVSFIQKSLDKSKISKKNLSEQLVETKSIISSFESNIESINNKKYLLEKKLENLENQIKTNKQQLNNYKNTINTMINNLLIVKIKLKQNSTLLFNKEQTTENIKNSYLNQLLEKEINNSKNLKTQIIQLESSYETLYITVKNYNDSLEQLKKNKYNYNLLHKNKLNQYQNINNKINQDLNKIIELKTKEKTLNKLLQRLLIKHPDNDEHDSNNSIISHDYILPIKSNIKVNFGEKKDGIINKGVLFEFIKNSNVISIDDGKIVYVGKLNNLGNVIIIQHNRNIVSIYCGVNPIIQNGSNVKKGTIIATTGNEMYQPLNGIYFELRYKGQPINPFK
jgi:septal ring factor EnvC (AmiA/AmiB activator)